MAAAPYPAYDRFAPRLNVAGRQLRLIRPTRALRCIQFVGLISEAPSGIKTLLSPGQIDKASCHIGGFIA